MIRLTDVVKEYPNGTHALNGLTLEIQDGEFVFMVGPSGSGKSTVIKVLIGEVEPTQGKVMVNGFSLRNIRERQIPYLRRTVGVIFQDFRLIEHKTVYDNMVFAMRAVGAGPKEIKKRIPYCLDLVGLDNKGRRLPSELSGAGLAVVVEGEDRVGGLAYAQLLARHAQQGALLGRCLAPAAGGERQQREREAEGAYRLFGFRMTHGSPFQSCITAHWLPRRSLCLAQ